MKYVVIVPGADIKKGTDLIDNNTGKYEPALAVLARAGLKGVIACYEVEKLTSNNPVVEYAQSLFKNLLDQHVLEAGNEIAFITHSFGQHVLSVMLFALYGLI